MKFDLKTLVSGAVTTALTMGLSTVSSAAMAAPEMEKCYGVVKAGKNDCSTSTHACAAQAPKDGEPKEWIYLPKGTCDKIVGGNTEKSS